MQKGGGGGGGVVGNQKRNEVAILYTWLERFVSALYRITVDYREKKLENQTSHIYLPHMSMTIQFHSFREI